MAPTDSLSPAGSSSYLSNTMYVGDGTWIASKNTFLFPNLVGMNFETMRYNGMGNRFASFKQYHHIIKAHGILAVITFLFIVPAAILIAQLSTRSQFWAIRLHIYLQILTILLSTVVFTLGWFAVGPSRSFTNPHHGIGLAIYVLILLQGLFGYIIYRRSNNHQTPRKLPLPVMLHEWVGKATTLLGFAQVPLGLALYGSPKFTFILYALWMALLLVLFFILKYKNRPFLYDENLNRVNESTFIEEEEVNSRPDRSKAPLGLFAIGAGVATSMREKLKRRNRGSDIIKNEKIQATRQDNQAEVGSFFEDEGQRSKNNTDGFLNKLIKKLTATGIFGFIKNRSDKKNNYRDDGYSSVSIDVPARPYRGRLDESAVSGVTTSTHQTREDWSRISMPIPDSRNPTNTTALNASETQPSMPQPVHQPYSNESSSDLDNSTIPSFHREGSPPSFKNKLLAAIGIGYFAKKIKNRGGQYSSELEREQKRRKITRVRIDEEEEEEERPPNIRNQPAGKPHTSFDQGLHESSDYTSDFSSSESSLASESNVEQNFQSSLTPGANPMIPLPSHRKSGSVETIKMPSMPPDRYGILHQESDVSQNISDAQYQKRYSSRRRRDSTAEFIAINNETNRQAVAAGTSRNVALAGAAREVAFNEDPRQADIAESSRHGELASNSRHGEVAENSRHGEVAENLRREEFTEGSKHGDPADNSRQLSTQAARYAASEEEEWKRSRSRVAKISSSAGDGLETTISVKVKVHEDKNHITLRRLTREEAAAEREARLASRRWRRAESVSSVSARDTAASHRQYKRSESETGRQPEYLAKSIPPAQAVTPSSGLVAGRKPVDSAYYPLKREPSKSGRLSATLAGSPESYETWSAMSPGNNDSGDAAAERRRRRRFERSQRSGVEGGIIGEGANKSVDISNI